MGEVYKVHCPKCGYEISLDLGVGFGYPQVYAEMQEDGKQEKLGNDIKDFFAEHPDGVIDPVPMITQCEECGEYDTAPSLKMYVLHERKGSQRKSNAQWSVAVPFHDIVYGTSAYMQKLRWQTASDFRGQPGEIDVSPL